MKQCVRDQNIFIFHENEESRLYRNFLTQWEKSWKGKTKKGKKYLEKVKGVPKKTLHKEFESKREREGKRREEERSGGCREGGEDVVRGGRRKGRRRGRGRGR